jgi:hypothetical protein
MPPHPPLRGTFSPKGAKGRSGGCHWRDWSQYSEKRIANRDSRRPIHPTIDPFLALCDVRIVIWENTHKDEFKRNFTANEQSRGKRLPW